MKSILIHALALTLLLLASPALHAADLPLVENGQQRAEIVVSEKRRRMTTLAALELRLFIEKMHIGRNQALGGGKAELQAFSPTGAGWNVPAKFGKLAME